MTKTIQKVKTTFIPFLLSSRLVLFLSGVLSAFSYAPYYYYVILLASLALLFYHLNVETKKRATLSAFIFGFGLGMSSLFWIRHALMVDNGAFAFLIIPALAGFGLLFGIFYLIPAFLSTYFNKGVARWLAFSCLFVIFEWIRSWIFTGFPWNLTGYIFADNDSLLQIVGVGGIYLLSLLTMLFASSFALLPQKKPFFLMLSVVLVCYGAGFLHLSENPTQTVIGVKLRLVQPNIEQSLKWDPLASENNYSKLLRLSQQESDLVTHIIWPETALPFLPQIHEENRLRLMSAMHQSQTLIAGGLRITQDKKLANSLFIFDDLANIVGFYDKAHLVPFGEYMPLRDILPIDKIVRVPGDLAKGNGPETIYIPKAGFAGPQICYEAIFPHEIINQHRRPEWMINLTNDAWYGISAGPYQHLAIAKTRAVEEGLPLVRATNNGVSAVIDAYGRIIASLDLDKEGYLDSALPRPAKRTLYARFGNKIPLGACLFGLLLAFILKTKNKSLKKS